MKIKNKIVISIGLFTSVLIIFIIYFVYNDSMRLLKENQEEIMDIQLKRASENIDYLIKLNEKETEKLSENYKIKQFFKGKVSNIELNKYLIDLMKDKNKNSYYKDFFLLNKNGKMESTTMKSAKDLDLSSRRYFKICKNSKKTVTSDILIAKSDQELILISLSPIFKDNKLIGFSGIAIKADYISGFIEKMALGEKGYYIILDSKGRIISHPDKDKITTLFDKNKSDYKDRIIITRDMKDLNYKIIALIKKEEINEKTNILLNNVYNIGFIGILISILISLFLADIIIAPIKRVNKKFEKLIQKSNIFDKSLKRNINEFDNDLSRGNNIHKLEKNSSIIVSKMDKFEIEKYTEKALKIYDNTLVFISKLSHDLRTPLTLIKGYSDVLLLSIDEDNKKYLDKINKSVKDMENIIRNELELAYEVTKETNLNKEEVDLKSFSNTLIEEMKSLSKQKNRKIIIKNDKIIGKSILDKTNIKRVVENVFNNALKYSNKEIIFNLIDEKDYLLIKIKDKGIGISEKDMENIKEMFYQNDKNSKGYGLGLYISKQIIDKHKFKLEIKSKLNKGTTVIIKIKKQKELTSR
ncbi:MAG: ATP-binding protein [Bacillota bacterium]